MIKLINKALPLTPSKLNLTVLVSAFSNQLQTTTYPYLFGGLKNVPFQKTISSQLLLDQLFGRDTFDGFKEAYKFTLDSLAQKQKQNLQNIFEPNLLKNITFKDVTFVSPEASIDVAGGKVFLAFGATFVRESSNELKFMDSKQDVEMYINLGLMGGMSNPAGMMKYMTSGIPFIMGFEVFFKTEARLVPQGKRVQKVPEIHSIQFEIESKIHLTKYMGLAMKLKESGGMNVGPAESLKIFKEMIGDNYEWKIGDIDRILNKNFKITK